MAKKEKPLYSLGNNLYFLINKSWEIDKTLLLTSIAQSPVIVLLPLLTTFLLKYMVELITNRTGLQTLFINISVLSLAILVLQILNNYFTIRIEWRASGNRFNYLLMCWEKILDTDYINIEAPENQIKMQKASNSLYSSEGATEQIFKNLINAGSSIIGLVSYSALIFALNPWIVVLLVVLSVLNYVINNKNIKWTHKNKNNWVPIDRKLNYLNLKAGDYLAAKDIRIYGMSKWFKDMFKILIYERFVWRKKEELRRFGIDFLATAMNFVRDGLAYVLLLQKIIFDGMPAAEFVFYFGLITQYSTFLFGLLNAYNAIQASSLYICDFREYLDLPDKSNRKKGVPIPEDTCEIEFSDVCFKYPGNSENTIKNLSFKINKGEKLAVVGLNGAGKTTMIKLLCNLYSPDSGIVKIDGQPVEKYNRDEFFKLFSLVFQDIYLMPVSLAKNVALCQEEEIDYKKLKNVFMLAGISKLVDSLPQKENTLLLKSVYDEAVDVSGGEKQKIALARALYKDGKIIVLDEPTAALDPIAENETYLRYGELTEGRTSVFISHRLSSTRFCDRILFMENGHIVEEGSHDELMTLNGKYAYMFNVQSHYYKEAKIDEKS